jgi:hypothetical protein
MKRLTIFAFATLLSIVSLGTKWQVVDFEKSIRPLSWTSVNFNPFEEQSDSVAVVNNHCTLWAYHTPANPDVTHWITAAHCVVDHKTGEYQDRDYQIDGKAVYVENWDVDHDIASLSAYGVDAPGLQLNAHDAQVLDTLVIRGYPYGLPFMVTTKGVMAALHAHFPENKADIFYNLYNVAVAPVNSGSPVFNEHGKVVGLLQIGWKNFTMSGGLSLDTLRIFLADLP